MPAGHVRHTRFRLTIYYSIMLTHRDNFPLRLWYDAPGTCTSPVHLSGRPYQKHRRKITTCLVHNTSEQDSQALRSPTCIRSSKKDALLVHTVFGGRLKKCVSVLVLLEIPSATEASGGVSGLMINAPTPIVWVGSLHSSIFRRFVSTHWRKRDLIDIFIRSLQHTVVIR